MKVAELRESLSKKKKEELIKLAVEFYKLVPKAKKEEYHIDSLVNNPEEKKSKSKSQFSLLEIEFEVNEFITNAKAQYYLIPNRVVPKKERSTWRFKVKKWYKELINTNRADKDINKQAEILSNLYELICESCGYNYFSGYDSFQSIGIEQTDFFKSVLVLMQEAEGKNKLIDKGINLIVDNYLNRYTLYSNLMVDLINLLDIPDLKIKGIEKTKNLLAKNNLTLKKDKSRSWGFDTGEFAKKEKNNNLTELGYRLYSKLFDYENAIKFYKENHSDSSEEVKLYILIRLLFADKLKCHIVEEIEMAIKNGVKPRQSLLNLLNEIKQNDQLPKYIR